jgi:hypothetical protein
LARRYNDITAVDPGNMQDDPFALPIVYDAPRVALICVAALQFKARLLLTLGSNAIDFPKFLLGPIPSGRQYRHVHIPRTCKQHREYTGVSAPLNIYVQVRIVIASVR